jgi:hypothetical protein
MRKINKAQENYNLKMELEGFLFEVQSNNNQGHLN